jgi:signal transduction histidine kinase
MRELTVAYEHALESDRMKTTFIQNMSHEVRTPLNIISGFAQVIADPDLTASREERMNIAKMMLTNTRIITKQIDEMLELAVNESKTAVRMEDGVDIVDLLSNQLQENQGLLKQGVRLVFDNQLPSGFVMTTNKEMIRRMVNILLDNAIKYTDEGTITLRAVIEDDSKLMLSVEDTGCGIPAEEANHIFERFVKLDTFKEGLGLGLPLCRMLAGRLNGFVIFDQTYAGPGARFVLTLPL